MKARGFLVVLSGPSGAGKNTLLSAVLPRIPDLKYSVSATTRPPRPGEKHGVDYYFLQDDEFQEMIDRGEFLEWAEFAGYRYGTPRRFVEECLAQGLTVITDIDIQGARQIKQRMPDGVFVFLLPPSFEELEKRLHKRGTDSSEAIGRRLKIALEEVAAIVDYDYWILNRDLEEACEQLVAIIRAERARVSRTDLSTLPL
ncbi:MAG TPA: guanylate kinase [Limnochordia bacterium]|nr:guanylate kinase [Limnochordia bacterium]